MTVEDSKGTLIWNVHVDGNDEHGNLFEFIPTLMEIKMGMGMGMEMGMGTAG